MAPSFQLANRILGGTRRWLNMKELSKATI